MVSIYNAYLYIYYTPTYKCTLSVYILHHLFIYVDCQYIYNLKILHWSYFLGVLRQTAPHTYIGSGFLIVRHFVLNPFLCFFDGVIQEKLFAQTWRRVGTYAFTEVAEVLRGGYDKPQPPQVGVLIHMHPMESNVIDAI